MRIFVLRHGETAENIDGMMQGNMDTVLDENGIKQALSVREEILSKNIDLIISSPKKRALDTATIAAPNIPIITDDRLKSRDHGEFEGLRRSQIKLNDYWNIKKDIKYERAESVKEFYNRINSLLDEIKDKYNDKNVLLVTHSGICRILYYYFNGIPEDGDLMGYESYNCSLEEYNL